MKLIVIATYIVKNCLSKPDIIKLVIKFVDSDLLISKVLIDNSSSSNMSIVINWILQLPWIDIASGIIIPIIVVIMATTLTNRNTVRKESNMLYIQIDILKKEILKNKKELDIFIELYEKYKESKELILLSKVPYSSEIIIEIFGELERIRNDYFYFDGYMYTSPSCISILDNDIKKIDEKIDEEVNIQNEMSSYGLLKNPDENKTKSILLREKLKKTEELKQSLKRNFFKEIKTIKYNIEQSGILVFCNNDEEEILKKEINKLYNDISEFVNINDECKERASKFYEKVFIEIEDFDDELFKEYYNNQYKDHIYYKTWRKYYYYKKNKDTLFDNELDISVSNWNQLSNDMVLLKDRELYLLIKNFYENTLIKCKQDEEQVKLKYDCCSIAQEESVTIIEKLDKHEKKLKKLCRR